MKRMLLSWSVGAAASTFLRFVASLLTPKGACHLLTTKQPAQIAQTAFSHNIEYFCFLRCLLDRGRVNSSKVSPYFSFQRVIPLSSARFTIYLPCFSAYCIVRYAPPLLCWIQHTTRSARSIILRLRTWIADFGRASDDSSHISTSS